MNDKDKKCCEECAVWDTYSENTYCAKSICPCHQEKKGWKYQLKYIAGDEGWLHCKVETIISAMEGVISQELETARKERDEEWRNKIAGVRGYSLLKQDATKEEILEELYKLLNEQ